MITWTGGHKDWILQPYINYIGPVAGLKLLNRAYSNAGLTAGVTTGYHTKYNTFRSDTGYFNNNVVSLDTNIPTSRQPKYNYYTGLLTGDVELLLMSRTNQALKHIVVSNTKHTNNIIKKANNMLA